MTRVIRSSAFNLAFGYVALGIVALVLFAAPLWYAWQVTIQDGRAEILQEDSQRLTVVFERDGPQGLVAFIGQRVGLQIANERILLLADSSLHLLVGNLPAWPAGTPLAPGTYTITVNLAGIPTPTMVVHSILPGDYHLLVGRGLAKLTPLENYFWAGLAGAVAVLVIVGIFGGIIIRRSLLSRVQGMGQTVAAIMHGDLTHRLSTRQYGDELDLLSGTINRMLDQIELLFRGVRNVSNAIAHDLRTPLAELRSRLEELTVTRPSADETFAEIEGAVADVDRVIRIFNALLRLAEIDSGVRRSGFVPVDAAQICRRGRRILSAGGGIKGCGPGIGQRLPGAGLGRSASAGAGNWESHRQCAQVHAR